MIKVVDVNTMRISDKEKIKEAKKIVKKENK